MLPSPSFAFDGVRTPPEELVNSASPNLRSVLRSRDNQPVPTFPRSPGIIRETRGSDLTLDRRSVHSLNCQHSSKYFGTDHDLICTGCPPKSGGEEVVDKTKPPMKSRWIQFPGRELFTEIFTPKSRGEQVVVWKIKNEAQRRGERRETQSFKTETQFFRQPARRDSVFFASLVWFSSSRAGARRSVHPR